nr:hypothetical protein [Microbacterium barkeri]
MTAVVVAIPQPRADELAAELELEGVVVLSVVGTPAAVGAELLSGAGAIIVPASRAVLTADLIATCDRAGVRIIALGGADTRLLSRLGLSASLPPDAAGWQVAEALAADPEPTTDRTTTPSSSSSAASSSRWPHAVGLSAASSTQRS